MTVAMLRTPAHYRFAAPVHLDAAATTWVQILEAGTWKHPQYGEMEITKEVLAELKRNFDAGVREFVYADYDHGIGRADGSGNAIASGEVKALELRNAGAELWAEYEPTEPAREKISRREYRYTSADFQTDYRDKKTGKAWGTVLRGFALTNVPYIEGMQPLALGERLGGAARLFADFTTTKEKAMATIAEKLGLGADASEAEIEAAIDSLLEKVGETVKAAATEPIAEAVEEAVKEAVEEAVAEAVESLLSETRAVMQLDESAGKDAIVGKIRSLAEEHAAMKKKGRESEADKVLTAALFAGKLTPAMKDTFRAQLLSEVPAVAAAAKEILEKMPKIVPIGERKADPSPAAETDHGKLLDETVQKIQKDNPNITYRDALIKAESVLDTAASGGEK